jgi:predicted kinase
MSKDDIKEFMFETLKQSDKAFSRIQGKASIGMLLAFAESFLKSNQSVMIESAFYADLARNDIRELVDSAQAKCLEIYCHADEDVRKTRFSSRARDGTRHPGHLDTQVADSINPDIYSELSIGETIDVNTTDGINQNQYESIIDAARRYLTGKGE